jgi:hypothetical protein
MANNTQWSNGKSNSGFGLPYYAAFSTVSGADLNVGLTSGQSMMSSVVLDFSFSSGTPDQFITISYVGALGSSSTIGAGANIALWIAYLQGDNSTYGDGLLTAGSAFSGGPAWTPFAIIPLYASTRSSVIGDTSGIMKPLKCRLIVQNNTSFTLGVTTTNQCYIGTYNQNLSAY